MKKLAYALLALTVIWVTGCNDDTQRPDPPPPPPQITLETYGIAKDPKHRIPDNDVFDILVDSQGRVWISTDQGVAMKDGDADMVYFDDFAGIPNRKCRGLAELNGKIWVGTWGGGVASYDGTLPWKALPISSSRLIDGQVFTITPDDSSVWIGTVVGITQYIDNPNLPEASRYKSSVHNNRLGSGPNDRTVSSFVVREDPQAGPQVWVGKLGGGITILPIPTGNGIQIDPGATGIPGGDVVDMAYDELNDRIWVAFDTHGLASVDPQLSAWRPYARVDGLDSEIGKSVDVKGNGEVWYGTQRGVTRREVNGDFTNFVLGSGLPGERVRVVHVDNASDRVWLGFIDAGAGMVLSHE